MANILAVDDSPSMLKMISIVANNMGHRMIAARDGKQALEYASMDDAELVLTDINMPVMDGITLVEYLRGIPAYANVPILIMTTESDAEHKMQGRIAGATGWLAKPITPERLEKAIGKMLD